MKAAFSTWDNRIAPVFDASNQIRLVEVESGKVVRSEQDALPEDLPVQKALRLAELKIDVLVCGAISRAMHDIVISYGIRIIPFVSGALDEIVQALVSGQSDWTSFSMPGCMGGGGRRSRGAGGFFQEEGFMGRRGAGGRGMGAGGSGGGRRSKTGGYGQGAGRMAGVSGDCVCQKCGQRQVHQRGVPCFEMRCPACGTPMVRE